MHRSVSEDSVNYCNATVVACVWSKVSIDGRKVSHLLIFLFSYGALSQVVPVAY